MAADSFPASDEDSKTDAWRIVERLAPFLRIAHQIPGRIRLKLDAGALAAHPLPAGEAGRLDAILSGIRGIRRVQLNLLARSCVVEYDAAVIPDAAWPDLLAGRDTPAAAVLAGILRETGATAGAAKQPRH